EPTPYQRVTSQYDVTEEGVPSLHYLSFDGVDDFMETEAVTPGTDKSQIFIGASKVVNSSGAIFSMGSANSTTGTIEVMSTGWGSQADRYSAAYRSDNIQRFVSPPNYAPPRTDVLSWSFNTAASTPEENATLRVSGA